MDLFAARHNKQLPRFYSFRPDPEAEAVDAMTQNWSKLKPYAFPPFILIGCCLRKMIQDQVMEMTIIVPMWENQTWFPALLNQLIDIPLLIPSLPEVLTNPLGETHPMVEAGSLLLVACRVQGYSLRQTSFR